MHLYNLCFCCLGELSALNHVERLDKIIWMSQPFHILCMAVIKWQLKNINIFLELSRYSNIICIKVSVNICADISVIAVNAFVQMSELDWLCCGSFCPAFSYVEKSRPRPNPVTAQFMPTNSFGAISEKLQKTVDGYISSKLKHDVCIIWWASVFQFKFSFYDLNMTSKIIEVTFS